MRIFLAFLCVFLFQLGVAQPIKVMSYNIRFDNPGDSVNAWPNRKDKVAALIRKYNPDIIGVQEALLHQLHDLTRILPDYSFVGVGRDDGKELGEYSAILYRHGRFGLLGNTTQWLSETPEVPGSKSWDAAITRIVTIARFYDKELKREFGIFNTHFDHVGKEARNFSAIALTHLINNTRTKNENLPIVLTGDFNCERSEPPYQTLVKDELLQDTKPVNDQTGTFCGFEVDATECRAIDFIFHTKEWILRGYKVIEDHDEKYYPSDHLPVLTEFELSLER